jgi:hypothetical protein
MATDIIQTSIGYTDKTIPLRNQLLPVAMIEQGSAYNWMQSKP